MIGKLLTTPHIAFNIIIIEFGKLLLDRVVCQMVLPRLSLRIVLLHAKTNVAFIVAPNGERIPIGHQHPLTDVKLPSFDNERILNTLLNDPETGIALQICDAVHNPLIGLVHFDSTASRTAAWLQEPQIFSAIHIELQELLFQFRAQFFNIFIQLFEIAYLVFNRCKFHIDRR